MKEFILVISMWGSDGATDHYIGQISLQQPFSEKQCNMLIEENIGNIESTFITMPMRL